MVLLPAHQEVMAYGTEAGPQGLWEFVARKKRLGLLVGNDPSEELAALSEAVASQRGQCIVLDALDGPEIPLADRFLTVLENWRENRPFRINLPDILRHNPNSVSPFINRAILWQRLGDRLIEEEEPERPTVLVLKNLDAADSKTQHDVARLVRFHATHRIRRTFLATIQADHLPFLEPEIRQLVDARFEF